MNDFDFEQPQRDILSVSQLASDVRQTLEDNFPLSWVEGEISNLAAPASGHIYFSLKDNKAQVRCAMFKMRKRLLDFEPENGMQVLVRAKVGLYEARGDFQLIIEHMEEAGDGAMRREYEALKRRLRNEGLFESQHKQSVPKLPSQIGIVTSPTGAAIHDMLTVLKRRFPSIPVLIYPVPVQGEVAAKKISKMIKLANSRAECDVLIISRGGGSLEDLWAFNDEHLAHTIFNSKIPIVSAVGHEVDFTIADFVADARAPTPSAAAELLSPDRNEWIQRFTSLNRRLVTSMQNKLDQNSQRMDWLTQRITSPQQRLQQANLRIKELQQRLVIAQKSHQQHKISQCQMLHSRLLHHTPQHRIQSYQQQHEALKTRLKQSMQVTLQQHKERLSLLGNTLDAVSPLATLGRGYSIVRNVETGELIRDAVAIKTGTKIETRLEKGRLLCTVDESLKD